MLAAILPSIWQDHARSGTVARICVGHLWYGQLVLVLDLAPPGPYLLREVISLLLASELLDYWWWPTPLPRHTDLKKHATAAVAGKKRSDLITPKLTSGKYICFRAENNTVASGCCVVSRRALDLQNMFRSVHQPERCKAGR